MTNGTPVRELHMGNGSVIVSFAVCTAIFDYAQALATAKQADVVNIPILFNGERADSNVLISPASQLFCTPAEDNGVDLDDAELVAELARRAALLVAPVRPSMDPTTTNMPDDLDFSL